MEATVDFHAWLKENFSVYDGVYYRENTDFIYDLKCLKKNFEQGKTHEGCGEYLWIAKWRVIDLIRFKKYCEENKIKPTLSLFNEWKSTH